MAKKRAYILAYSSLLALISIIALFFLEIFPAIDFQVSNFFLSIQLPFLIVISQILSFLASTYFLIPVSFLIAIILIIKVNKKSSIFYLFNMIFGVIIELTLKSIIQRQRPINPYKFNFSFPSGHSTASVLLFGSLAFLLWNRNRKIAYLGIAMPFLIGLSRLYLNVHWLSDVIGGFAIGLLWLCISILIFYRKKETYSTSTSSV